MLKHANSEVQIDFKAQKDCAVTLLLKHVPVSFFLAPSFTDKNVNNEIRRSKSINKGSSASLQNDSCKKADKCNIDSNETNNIDRSISLTDCKRTSLLQLAKEQRKNAKSSKLLTNSKRVLLTDELSLNNCDSPQLTLNSKHLSTSPSNLLKTFGSSHSFLNKSSKSLVHSNTAIPNQQNLTCMPSVELNKTYIFNLRPYNNIQFLKFMLIKKLNVDVKYKDIQFFFNGTEVPNQCTIMSLINDIQNENKYNRRTRVIKNSTSVDFLTCLNNFNEVSCSSTMKKDKDLEGTELNNLSEQESLFSKADQLFKRNRRRRRNNKIEITLKWRFKEKICQKLNCKSFRPCCSMYDESTEMYALVKTINEAFNYNIPPKLADFGTGGTYFLTDRYHKLIAAFKPQDEEAFCPYNPRGYTGEIGSLSFRKGVYSGDGCFREVAAYLIDERYNFFSTVPPTFLVEAVHPHFCYNPDKPNMTKQLDRFDEHIRVRDDHDDLDSSDSTIYWKLGSLQMFINNSEPASDYSPDLFCVHDVHKIAILDIRLFNLDRNDNNIMVIRSDQLSIDKNLYNIFARSEYEEWIGKSNNEQAPMVRLIPIDHGLSLPKDCLKITSYDLAWYYWPQSDILFSKKTLEYIARLDPDEDARILRSHLRLPFESLRLMQASTRLLKIGAKHNLTVREIASMYLSDSTDSPSVLESSISLSLAQAYYSYNANKSVFKRASVFGVFLDLATPASNNMLANTNSGRSSMDNCESINNTFSLNSQMPSLFKDRNKTSKFGAAEFINNEFNKKKINNDSFNSLWSVGCKTGELVAIDLEDERFIRIFLQVLEVNLETQVIKKLSHR